MRRNIRLLELQEIGMSALFILPVIVAYFRDEIGLSFQEFLIAEAIFAATIVLMEVPSGWISDIWKRKHVLKLSIVFWFLGFYLFMLADSLAMVALSQIVMGIGFSLLSGTNAAMLCLMFWAYRSNDRKELKR